MKARHIFYALSSAALLLAAAPVQMASPRPVMVGGIAELDACSSQGQPHNLNPRGDNFLTVRAAPTTSSASVFRLKPGHIFNLCDEASGGAWHGIVFDPKAPNADGPVDCGVGTPIAKRQPYRGPCMQGWVSARYVLVVAG